MRSNFMEDKQTMRHYILYGVYYPVRLSQNRICHFKAHDQSDNFVYGSYSKIEWLPEILQNQAA